MLRVIKNVTWRDHIENKTLYGTLPKLTTTIAERRLRFSGHCLRSKEELINKVILWEPQHGNDREEDHRGHS